MESYSLILLADILLATAFIFQKKYQRVAGISLKAGITYNFLSGLFCAIMFLFINRFEIQITGISIFMALMFSSVIMLYTLIGFRLMAKGNMSIYSLFLMAGGMTVPYVFGVLFLNETLTFARILGLITILAAIIISNISTGNADKKQILMCITVFFLNGLSSVISKVHQINPVSKIVTSPDFAFLVMIFKVLVSSVILFVNRKNFKSEAYEKISVKKVVHIALFAAIADGFSYMLQLIGAIDLPATVLYPMVTGGSVILTSLAGVVVYKERPLKRQWFGVVLCFVGTLLFL